MQTPENREKSSIQPFKVALKSSVVLNITCSWACGAAYWFLCDRSDWGALWGLPRYVIPRVMEGRRFAAATCDWTYSSIYNSAVPGPTLTNTRTDGHGGEMSQQGDGSDTFRVDAWSSGPQVGPCPTLTPGSGASYWRKTEENSGDFDLTLRWE